MSSRIPSASPPGPPAPEPAPGYGALLAHIHHEGFGFLPRAAASTLLRLLREAGFAAGTVVDLGCGSGILSGLVVEAGFDAHGFDLSEDMLAVARAWAPRATFERAALRDAQLPPCVAVAVVGECFNYTFHPSARSGAEALDTLAAVARRAHAALAPGGVLLMDVATPGRVGPEPRVGARTEGDWTITYRAAEDAAARSLVREIASVRRLPDGGEERAEERHVLSLLDPEDVTAALAGAGFAVTRRASYDGLDPLPGLAVFAGRKRAGVTRP